MAEREVVLDIVLQSEACDTSCVPSMDIFDRLDDDQYQSLQRCLLASGKGRRPALPQVLEVNNKLLLQLFALKTKSCSSFQIAYSWLQRLFPDTTLDSARFKYLLEKVWSKAIELLHQNVEDFKHYLAQENDLDFISETLSAFGLNRKSILQPEGYIPPALLPELTNGFIVDLEFFRAANKLKDSFVTSWVCRVLNDESDAKIIGRQITKVIKDFKNAQKRKSRHPDEFKNFVKGKFVSKSIVGETPNVATEPSSISLPTKSTKSSGMQTTKLSYKHVGMQTLDDKVSDELKQTVSKLKADKKKLSNELQEVKEELEGIKKSKLYKSNFQMKKDLVSLREQVGTLQLSLKENAGLLSERDNQIAYFKKKCLNTQKDRSRLKKQKEDISNKLNESISLLQSESEETKVATQDSLFNKYSDDLRTTVMSLCGEAGIATSKCPMVIDIVAQQLFHQKLNLPHWTTTTKWMDEFNVIAKVHIAEQCLNSSHLTLHTDATSRDKRRFVGQQITLDDGSIMSLGYSEVAVEDAQTLLEVTMAFLEDLIDVVENQQERDVIFKEILAKVSSTMSDRASVMKCFNRQFHDLRKSRLGQEVTTQFLYCNAHFLLGLSTACEESLREAEKGTRFGRDKSPAFQHWNNTEGATARLIRTTADCLGPRGDEKSGCREEWLAYCREKNLNCNITSYRSNRFNNIFHNAEAIVLLRDEIITFLTDYASSSNLKLKSVLLDLNDPVLFGYVRCLALIHKYVSGPYWRLVNSKVQYLQLPLYIQMMESALSSWHENIGEMFSASCLGVFGEKFFYPENLVSILSFPEDLMESMQNAIKPSVSKMLEVLRRQLADFLPGGVFGGEVEERVHKELENCPVTNLSVSGEHAFGDLDYDLNTRRHTTLHNRSTKHMVKWNKDAAWLENKSDKERSEIWKAARLKKKLLKSKFRKQEEIVKLRVKSRIIQNQQMKLEKERQVAERKQKIVERLLKDGGVCKTKKDVSRLQTVDSLKMQLLYHKIVVGNNKITLTGDKQDLRMRLETYLDKGEVVKSFSPPTKKRHLDEIENDSTLSSDSDNISDDEVQETAVIDKEKFTFKGTRQGMWLAVYYDDSPYIGQVIDTVDEQNATMKFLTATKCQADLFKWPRCEDIAVIHEDFIFKWDLDVLPVSSDGRTWRVVDFKAIASAYRRIQNQPNNH